VKKLCKWKDITRKVWDNRLREDKAFKEANGLCALHLLSDAYPVITLLDKEVHSLTSRATDLLEFLSTNFHKSKFWKGGQIVIHWCYKSQSRDGSCTTCELATIKLEEATVADKQNSIVKMKALQRNVHEAQLKEDNRIRTRPYTPSFHLLTRRQSETYFLNIRCIQKYII